MWGGAVSGPAAARAKTRRGGAGKTGYVTPAGSACETGKGGGDVATAWRSSSDAMAAAKRREVYDGLGRSVKHNN